MLPDSFPDATLIQSVGRGQPKVSIFVFTYNFQEYIGECLDSVLMQETDFDYEVVVLDDFSTDHTRQILLDYQAAYPNKISLILGNVNKCDNTTLVPALEACRSPYFAILDGDDYWIRADKLQKQVDYLDQHPQCVICFHNASRVWFDHREPSRNSNPPWQKQISTLEDLLPVCFVSTSTALLRRSVCGPFPSWYVEDRGSDYGLFLMAAQHGTIDYLNEVMSVYRLHDRGLWTGATKISHINQFISLYELLLIELPAEHQGRLNELLARKCLELAVEHDRGGNSDAAQRALLRALEVVPVQREFTWSLRCTFNNAAHLVFPADDQTAIRVEIQQVGTAWPFDIQLNRLYLILTSGQTYTIRFRARADRLRKLAVGMAQDHEPWQGLGFYSEVELTPGWQTFEFDFIASQSEDGARIHFDGGAIDISFEVAGVSIQDSGGHEIDRFSLSGENGAFRVEHYRDLASTPRPNRPVLRPTTMFRVAAENSARIVIPSPGAVRIEIENLGAPNSFDVQLNAPNYRIVSGMAYKIQFQARADAPRDLFVGAAQAHEPWGGLGLYQMFNLQTSWQTYETEFEASAEDGNARIHFDAGDNGVSLEVAGLVLLQLADGEVLDPHERTRFEFEGSSLQTVSNPLRPVDPAPTPDSGDTADRSAQAAQP